MKPYYQDSAVTIYHGDCREILPTLPRVDLVLTDPPWLASKSKLRSHSKGIGKSYEKEWGVSYGDIGELDKQLVIDCINVSLRAVVFTGTKEISEFDWKFIMFWNRPNPMPTPVLPYHQSVSPILLFGDWQGIKLGDQMVSVAKLNAGCIASPERILEQPNGKAAHPCQMPMSLANLFLLKLDGTILDPFMGSGTTLRAAKDLNRKAIGIEIEEKYCEIAAKRMAQEVFNFE